MSAQARLTAQKSEESLVHNPYGWSNNTHTHTQNIAFSSGKFWPFVGSCEIFARHSPTSTVSIKNSGSDLRSAQLCIRQRSTSEMKRRLSVTNFSSENNLPTFRLNAPVVIRAKVKKCEQTLAMHY